MLKQKLILSFSSKIFIHFMQMTAGIIVARIAGPTVLGTVAFGMAYVSSFQFISGLGLGGAHIKLISEGKDPGKCLATFLFLRIFTTAAFVIVVISFYFIQINILNVQFESKTHQYVIFIVIITSTIQSFLSVPERTFEAKTEQAKRDIPELVRITFSNILRVVVVLLGYKALTLALCNLLSTIVVIPLILYLFRDYSFGTFDKEIAKQYVKIAAPLIILFISETMLRYLDKVLLQFFTNSEQVGYYTAGFRVGGFLMIIATGIGIFFPLFSKAVAEKNYEYIKDKIDKYERLIFIFLMPTVLFLAIYSDSIILLFLGKKYIPSIDVMTIITIAIFIRVLTIPYGNILTGLGLFKLAAKLHLINIFIFVGILIIFINNNFLNLKAVGTAFALLVSNLFLGISYVFFAKRNMDIVKKINNYKFIIFGVLNFILFYFFYKYFIKYWGNSFRLFFPLFYFLGTYICLILIKWIKKDDLKMLKSFIDFKSMKKYISSEMKSY